MEMDFLNLSSSLTIALYSIYAIYTLNSCMHRTENVTLKRFEDNNFIVHISFCNCLVSLGYCLLDMIIALKVPHKHHMLFLEML